MSKENQNTTDNLFIEIDEPGCLTMERSAPKDPVDFKTWDELDAAADALFKDVTPADPDVLFQEINEEEMIYEPHVISETEVKFEEEIIVEEQFVRVPKAQSAEEIIPDIQEMSEPEIQFEEEIIVEEQFVRVPKARCTEEIIPDIQKISEPEIQFEEEYIIDVQERSYADIYFEEKVIAEEQDIPETELQVEEDFIFEEDLITDEDEDHLDKPHCLIEEESSIENEQVAKADFIDITGKDFSDETDKLPENDIVFNEQVISEAELQFEEETISEIELSSAKLSESQIGIVAEGIASSEKLKSVEIIAEDSPRVTEIISPPIPVKGETEELNQISVAADGNEKQPQNEEGDKEEMANQSFYDSEQLKKLKEELDAEMVACMHQKKADDDVDLFREAEELLHSVNPNVSNNNSVSFIQNASGEQPLTEVEAPYEFDFIW